MALRTDLDRILPVQIHIISFIQMDFNPHGFHIDDTHDGFSDPHKLPVFDSAG